MVASSPKKILMGGFGGKQWEKNVVRVVDDRVKQFLICRVAELRKVRGCRAVEAGRHEWPCVKKLPSDLCHCKR